MNRKVEGFIEVNSNIRKPQTLDIDNNQSIPLIGAVPAAVTPYVTAVRKGDGVYNQVVLTLTDLPITMRDTEQGGGAKIFTFPEGRIAHVGSVASIAVTTTSELASTLNTGKTCNWGVGTLTQSSATVTGTEQDLVNVAAFISSTTIDEAGSTVTGVGPGVLASHDGASTAIAAFLNLAVAGGADIDGNATVTVSGTITINWTNIGDY